MTGTLQGQQLVTDPDSHRTFSASSLGQNTGKGKSPPVVRAAPDLDQRLPDDPHCQVGHTPVKNLEEGCRQGLNIKVGGIN